MDPCEHGICYDRCENELMMGMEALYMSFAVEEPETEKPKLNGLYKLILHKCINISQSILE